MKFKQCRLEKDNVYQIAFIPDKYAVVGKYLKINNDNGWFVVFAGKAVDKKVLDELHKVYLPSVKKGAFKKDK